MTAVFLSWWRAFVMLQHPEASPWCSERCSLSVLCHITHNCLTPSQHGHSVGLGHQPHISHSSHYRGVYVCHFFSSFSSGCSLQRAFPCIWQDMGVISEIHQRICVTLSYFLSSRFSFWYYTLIFLAPLLSAIGRKIKKKKEKRLSSPPACSPHSRLYWFPLKLYFQKTGRMWALIFPTLRNTWTEVAR